MSSACVSIALGAAEHRWFHKKTYVCMGYPISPYHVQSVRSWRRYVDDLLAVSRRLCRECMFTFISGAFTMTLSAVSDLKGNGDHVGTWLDTEVSFGPTITHHAKERKSGMVVRERSSLEKGNRAMARAASWGLQSELRNAAGSSSSAEGVETGQPDNGHMDPGRGP